MYSEKDLVRIGKRENNKKRNYLVVNRLQGKHIPVSPSEALKMFDELADIIRESYPGERLLLIGFAETATAIGAEVAIKLGGYYIQTTREIVEDVNYLFFSEAHSHATEQKLVKEDIDEYIGKVDRIVFIEDEVTTGNTILNIINIFEDLYVDLERKKVSKDSRMEDNETIRKIKFSVASLLNGMNDEHLEVYKKRGIDVHYLVKINNEKFGELADSYNTDGEYVPTDTTKRFEIKQFDVAGWLNARRVVDANEYEKQCQKLWEEIQKKIDFDDGSSVLVVGTEEFMYPALFVGARVEKFGCKVRSHSTTRSPIEVCKMANKKEIIEHGRNSEKQIDYDNDTYPVHVRYELCSLYDDNRKTFIYDIDSYDKVLILTDSHYNGEAGINSLVNALSLKNDDIYLIRWCK